MTFREVCGYRDEVWGSLQYDAGVHGILAEPGKDITLYVRRPPVNSGINIAVNEVSYSAVTDENGYFHLSGVDLQKGDQVYIRLKERNGDNYVNSEKTHPTFPFDEAIILEADFFNDYIKGYVPPVIVKDWNTGGQKELIFELNKSKNSSLKVYPAGKDTNVDSHGLFNLTGVNVLPSDSISCQLMFDGWVVVSEAVKPTVDFSGQSIRIPVSYERTVDDGKPADVSKVDETIVITNNRGSKVYTGDASYTVSGYTQAAALCYIIDPKTGLPVLQAFGLEDQTKPVKLNAMQGTEEGTLGASFFVNSITKEWIWEPNPETESMPGSEIKPYLPEIPSLLQIQPPIFSLLSSVTAPPRVIIPTPPIIAPTPTDVPTRPPAVMTTPTDVPTRPPAVTTTPTIVPTRPPVVTPTPSIILPTLEDTEPEPSTAPSFNPGITQIRPLDPDFNLIFPQLPQNSFLLLFDDLFDKYDDYEYYNTYTGKTENYSEQSDGTQMMKWDSRVVIPYEGVQIVVEIKDERRDSNGDSKFETLSAEWLNRDVEGMLNRYMEKIGGSLVFPMPDEINKADGIANIGELPAWSSQAAQKMVDAGFMDLGTGGTFKSGNVTRSECAAYLVHAFGIAPEMKKSVFSDIVPANPYIPEINAAVSYGIISGYSSSVFGPEIR